MFGHMYMLYEYVFIEKRRRKLSVAKSQGLTVEKKQIKRELAQWREPILQTKSKNAPQKPSSSLTWVPEQCPALLSQKSGWNQMFGCAKPFDCDI